MTDFPAAHQRIVLRLCGILRAASARNVEIRLTKRARSEPPLRLDHRSGSDWRTVGAVRRHNSNVDFLSDAQRVFKFHTEVSYSAINLYVSEQQLNRPEISGFAVISAALVRRSEGVP